jgi:hypothetical protein
MVIRNIGTPAGFRATHHTTNERTGDIETLAGRGADGECWVLGAQAAISGIEAGLMRVMVSVDGVLRPAVVSTDSAGGRHLRAGEYFASNVT